AGRGRPAPSRPRGAPPGSAPRSPRRRRSFPTPSARRSRLPASSAQARAGQLELLVGDAGRAELARDAAVAPLELGEDPQDRLGRGRADPPEPLELRLVPRRLEPRLVPRPQPLLAERVVGG